MTNISFNAQDVPESRYEPIPPGPYRVAAVSSSLKQNKKGNGSYVEFALQVLDGPHKNRQLFARFTHEHSESEKAVEIGRRQLASLCLACGRPHIERTEDLHDIPIEVDVTVEQNSSFGSFNEAKRFRAAGAAQGSGSGSSSPGWSIS